VAVLDSIEMNVVGVSCVVRLVPQGMFPVSALPNSTFTFVVSARRDVFALWQAAGEARFDQAPARCEVAISVRQGPHSMQVVREDDDGVDREWMPRPCVAKCGPEKFDMVCQQSEPAVCQVDSEEKLPPETKFRR
jgi:hypothetical protein